MKSWRRTTSVPKGVDEVPVLIVGAGAGRLATPAFLAKYGVESLVVEKRSEAFLYPKARNLSFRSWTSSGVWVCRMTYLRRPPVSQKHGS
jgi:hypothetical protein